MGGVSIHAPVRERRYREFRPDAILSVSIHAPVRERRSRKRRLFRIISGFNSRSREGATLCRAPTAQAVGFNSRSREGATSRLRSSTVVLRTVSIHAPVRERPLRRLPPSDSLRFNSRSREGATGASLIQEEEENGFNSRSREGATSPTTIWNGRRSVSIHAPVRERRQQTQYLPRITRFNSRSREGATLEPVDFFVRKVVSIHAPVRERPTRRTRWRASRTFQFTLP